MENKKYYYLKFKEDFFENDSMILLESMENGYLYSNILMKMYLRSLKSNGRLMLNDRIPYNTQMLSKVLRHNVDVVEKAIEIFKQLDLIEILDNGAIYMLDIQNFIGQSSTDGDRKRLYRKQINDEKKSIGQIVDKCPDIQPPEIDIDIDINNNNTCYNNNINNNNININNKKEENKIKEEKKLEDLYAFIKSNFNRTLSPIECSKINKWFNDCDIDIIKYAIEKSVLNNAKKFNYVEAILNNWKSAGYKTINDIKEKENKIKDLKSEKLEELPEYDWLNE